MSEKEIARKFLDEYPKSTELRCISEPLRDEISKIMVEFSLRQIADFYVATVLNYCKAFKVFG